jgi:hypothetical protein
LVEVVAAFSLAADLALGQPMEHGLRSCMSATRLAEFRYARCFLSRAPCSCW